MLRIQALHPKIHLHDTTNKLRSGDLTYNEASNSPEPTLEAIPRSLLHELCGTSPPQIYILPQPTCTFVITIRIAASKFGRSTFSIGQATNRRSRGRGRGRAPLASTRDLRGSDLWSETFGRISEWISPPFLVYTCAVL